MARITVEDCLVHEHNRFALVRLASRRAKQLLMGDHTVTDDDENKAVVTSLREIAEGKVRFHALQPQNADAVEEIVGVNETE